MKKENKVVSLVRINKEYRITVELDNFGWYRVFDHRFGDDKKRIYYSDSFLQTAKFFVKHVTNQEDIERQKKKVHLF